MRRPRGLAEVFRLPLVGRSFNTGAAEPENALRPGTPPHRAAAFAAPERKELLSCDRSCDSAMHDGLGQQLHVVTQKGHSRPVDVNPVVGRGGSSSRELQANMRKIRGCRGCRPRVSSQVLGEPHRGPGNRPATGLHAHAGTRARAYQYTQAAHPPLTVSRLSTWQIIFRALWQRPASGALRAIRGV